MITPASIGLPSKFSRFRPEVKQEETILSIVSSDTRFNILQAPPGVGKSLICPSVGLVRGDRILYLTKSKSLQRQLYSDMSTIGLIDIVGHSNYPCASVKYDPTGEMADLICEGRRKLNGRGHCHYDELVVKCNDSNFVSTNYAHWVQTYLSNDPDRLGKFDLIICDEAHNIASGSCLLGDLVSIKFFSSTIQSTLDLRMPTYGKDLTIDDYISWSSIARDKACQLKEKLVSRNGDYREVLTLDRLISDLDRLNSESSIADFVIIPTYQGGSGGGRVSGVQFKPTNIAHYTETYLFRNISSVLLCSATIFREDIELLGIDQSNCTFHEVSSSFSWKRRPFIYYPTIPPIKCDRSMGEGERRIWVDRLDLLMQVESGKGIIQSRSYDRAEDILSRSRHHKQIIAYDRSTSREAIEKFRSSPAPCTLIGPTIEEGEDFPGDLCSYVIWPKVPFLNSYDPFISRMKEKDKDYTNREVCRSIIQGSLRGMRFDMDWCRIWMIDKHWSHFKTQPYFFSWFRKAFMMIKGLNEMPKPKEMKK